GILLPFRVAADPEITGTNAPRHGVCVVTCDSALHDDAGVIERRQDACVDALLVTVEPPHLGDDLSFLEQVIKAGAIEHGEPALFASVLQRLDQHGSAALGYSPRHGLNVLTFLVLASQIGEIV